MDRLLTLAQEKAREAMSALVMAHAAAAAVAQETESPSERVAAKAMAEALDSCADAVQDAVILAAGKCLALADLEASERASGGSDTGGAAPWVWVLVPAKDRSRHGRKS